MGATAVSLSSGQNVTDGTVFVIPAITPTARALVAVWAFGRASTAPTVDPTMTSDNLTLVSVTSAVRGGQNMHLYRSMTAAPAASVITVDYGASTRSGFQWCVDEYAGVDTSGTNGSGAVVQSTQTSSAGATSLTAILAAFGDATNNAVAAAFSKANLNALTAGTGFAIVSTNTGLDEVTVDDRMATEFKVGEDTGVDMSWVGSTACLGIAIEIKAAMGSGAYYQQYYRSQVGAGAA